MPADRSATDRLIEAIERVTGGFAKAQARTPVDLWSIHASDGLELRALAEAARRERAARQPQQPASGRWGFGWHQDPDPCSQDSDCGATVQAPGADSVREHK